LILEYEHPDDFIHMELHCSGTDPFTLPETTARANMYGVTGYPTIRVDGKYGVVGAGNCTGAYNAYNLRYDTRMSETGGISPVSIEGTLVDDGHSGTVSATYTLLDPASLGSIQATLFVYEDDVYWCCGYGGVDTWDRVVRFIRTSSITLVNPGDEVTVSENFTVGAGWNPENLHAVAILQEASGQRTIIQGGRLNRVSDFALAVDKTTRSVPQGSGTGLFTGAVQNTSLSDDVVTLSVGQFPGWATDFQVEGDPNWYTNLDVALTAGQSKGLTVRAQTDGTLAVETATLSGVSANSGRERTVDLQLYNGSYSVFLVDDDGAGPYEAPFVSGLTNLGYLFRDWDVHFDHDDLGPLYSDIAGYDAVIWSTGYSGGNLLAADDIGTLKQYLDHGGNLYMCSMDLLSSSPPAFFGMDYLGVQTFTNTTKAHTEYGVAGDPITDGFVLPLTFVGGEAGNRVDTVNPTSSATTIFLSEIPSSNALRQTLGSGGKVVFSTIPHDAYPQGAAPPNNSDTVLEKILDWFLPNPAGVLEATPAPATRMLAAEPNPFHPRTALSFEVSREAARSDVHLSLVDASGRLVRTLVDGKVSPGLHRMIWDGEDNSGRPAASGIYFARLTSVQGESTAKLVLAR